MLSDAIALVRLSYLVCKWTLLYHKVVTIKLHDLGYTAASCSSANACQHTPCLPLFAYSHSQYGTRLVQCSGSVVQLVTGPILAGSPPPPPRNP